MTQLTLSPKNNSWLMSAVNRHYLRPFKAVLAEELTDPEFRRLWKAGKPVTRPPLRSLALAFNRNSPNDNWPSEPGSNSPVWLVSRVVQSVYPLIFWAKSLER